MGQQSKDEALTCLQVVASARQARRSNSASRTNSSILPGSGSQASPSHPHRCWCTRFFELRLLLQNQIDAGCKALVLLLHLSRGYCQQLSLVHVHVPSNRGPQRRRTCTDLQVELLRQFLRSNVFELSHGLCFDQRSLVIALQFAVERLLQVEFRLCAHASDRAANTLDVCTPASGCSAARC